MTSVLGCGESRRSGLEELLFEALPRLLGTTNYLYDGNNDIGEVDNAGNVLARYIQGDHIDEPFAELRSGTTSYYEDDGSDSITSLTSSAGALSNSYAYDSF